MSQHKLVPSAETVLAQAQVFASTWSRVGGVFDDGSALATAKTEKAILADMVARLLDRITELEERHA